MLVNTLKRAAVGFLLGIILGDLIAVLTSSASEEFFGISARLFAMSGGNVIVAVILQSLFSGLYGAVCFGTMAFYDIERLPLALATALHCASIILPFIPLALMLDWFGSLTSILVMSCIQLVVFFIIWLIMYSVYKKQVKELNELMNKGKTDENDVTM